MSVFGSRGGWRKETSPPDPKMRPGGLPVTVDLRLLLAELAERDLELKCNGVCGPYAEDDFA